MKNKRVLIGIILVIFIVVGVPFCSYRLLASNVKEAAVQKENISSDKTGITWEKFSFLPESDERFDMSEHQKIYFKYKADEENEMVVRLNLATGEFDYYVSDFYWRDYNCTLNEKAQNELLEIFEQCGVQGWESAYNMEGRKSYEASWELMMENPNETVEVHLGSEEYPEQFERFVELIKEYANDHVQLPRAPKEIAPLTVDDFVYDGEETFRGIRIGDNADDVFMAYGYPDKETAGGNAESIRWWKYSCKEGMIEFEMDYLTGEIWDIYAKIQ